MAEQQKVILNFKWPDKSKLSQGAFDAVRKLQKAGFEAYIAGGAVRDALLKRPIKEIDIATSAKPKDVKKFFKKTIPTGEKHGTVTVFAGRGTTPYFPYEITTFRAEGKYEKSRRPKTVKFIQSAEEDAKRRDFTVNALFFDVQKGEVIDFVNGLADLSHKKIRLVGESEKRIREDALRMLRAARLSAAIGFGLSRETQGLIKKNTKLIKNISAERIKQELDYMLSLDNPSVAFGMLDVTGLLFHVLPEIKALQGVNQPKNHHAEGDVYTHSLLAIEKFTDDYDLPTRWAVLLHDIGKKDTRKVRSGKTTFYGHQTVGSEKAGEICRRLKFSSGGTEKIVWLVRHHMIPNDFAGMRLGRRRKWGLSPYFEDLLLVYLADAKASIRRGKKQNYRPYKEGQKILREIKAKPKLQKPLLSGNDVMKILKIKPGPLVGKVLQRIENLKLENEIRSKTDALKYLRTNKNKFPE